MFYRTWAEISTQNLIKNVNWLKKKANNAKIAAVLKADAYGHGLVPVARTIESEIDLIVVATLQEGVTLRDENIKPPILIIGPLIHEEELLTALEMDLIVSIAFIEQAKLLDRLAKSLDKLAKVHVQVDTGMNRTGVPYTIFQEFWNEITGLGNLKVVGVFSHFIASDTDPELTQIQHHRFLGCLNYIGLSDGITVHMANSASVITFPRAIFDMIRPGISVYGWAPARSLSNSFNVLPAMTVKSRVLQVKLIKSGETVSYGPLYRANSNQWVATVGIGYADLIPRGASNRGYLLIRNKKRKILGAVTMDLVMVEADESVRVGDEVVVLGRQGDEFITVHDIAEWANTIPYEVLVRLGKRVKRVYF